MTRIVFRTDAATNIGTGHVMRCLTLSFGLKAKGADCHFICKAHDGRLMEKIAASGFVVHALGPKDSGRDTNSRRSIWKSFLEKS